MKIIVMNRTTCDDENCHTGFSALGHEIHLGRLILLDMLHNNYIDENDVIVTFQDRFFLYSKLFKLIITHEQYFEKYTKNEQQLQIWPFMVSSLKEINHYYIKDFESKINYPIRQKLYERFERNFDDIISKIDYPIIPDALIPSKNFVVIHLRTFNKNLKSNNNFVTNYEVLLRIIAKIKDKYPHFDTYVFSSQTVTLDLDIPDIKIINELNVYAALMNHDYCEAVISELSGGGEFSQYCHNKKIYLYGGSYSIDSCVFNQVSSNQNENLLHSNWNCHGTTNASLEWFNSANDLLEKLDSHTIL
jgi:hypothetical protein